MTDTAHDATDLFLALTPEKVLDAVEAAGIACNPVCYPLNSFENRVYLVERDDRSKVVAKFYRPRRWTTEQIAEEHRFLSDLRDADIPTCGPIPFPDGTTLHQVDGHIHYTVFEALGGRAPEELDEAQAERLGMLVARIHNVGAAAPANARLPLRADHLIRTSLRTLVDLGVIPPHLEDRYVVAAERLADVADRRMTGVPVHRIHGDFHKGNLLLRDGVFHVLDLDDFTMGPAVQDLWMLLPGRDPETLRLRESFIEGYETFRGFDRATLGLIEPLRGMRMVHYSAWLARRWRDPIFPRTWPHFAEPGYWEDETRELEDLCTHIDADEPGAPVAGAEEELSNKDFFWDWNE